MKKFVQILAIPLMIIITCSASIKANTNEKNNHEQYIKYLVAEDLPKKTEEQEPIYIQALTESISEEEQVSNEDIELIALITMGEAEGESEEGKRLVIDTILNRVDSEHFPDNVHDVIYQKNQFSCVWDGRLNRVSSIDKAYQLVKEEIESRSNDEVIFFTAGKYSKYGKPMFNVGKHYFSSY